MFSVVYYIYYNCDALATGLLSKLTLQAQAQGYLESDGL